MLCRTLLWISVDDFKALRSDGCCHVDKTMLIGRVLGDLVADAVSARMLSDEHSYRMFVTGLLMSLRGRCRITADFESGDGYRDIRMVRSQEQAPTS